MEGPIWDLRQKRLNEIEEYYQKEYKNRIALGAVREDRKYYNNNLEQLGISGRKGLYITEYYKGIINFDLLVWETNDSLIELKNHHPEVCKVLKEELIRIAESMRI